VLLFTGVVSWTRDETSGPIAVRVRICDPRRLLRLCPRARRRRRVAPATGESRCV
jgi:hypothetical protein